eukprot:jgi/Botrbrau1/8484/Bobra.0237s0099.1
MELQQGPRLRNIKLTTRESRFAKEFQSEAPTTSGGGDANVGVRTASSDKDVGVQTAFPGAAADPGGAGSAAEETAEGHSRWGAHGLDTWAPHGPNTWSVPGLAAYGAFLLASCAYFWIRTRQLPELGPFFKYGLAVLLAEMVGCSAVVLYGLCIIRKLPGGEGRRAEARGVDFRAVQCACSWSPATQRPIEDCGGDGVGGTPGAASAWLYRHYMAAGRWAGRSQGRLGGGLATPCIRYLSGRQRQPDEVNGKAGNLNNAIREIFPPGRDPSPNDVVAVFDCDQVCDPAFFLHTLPVLDDSPEVGLVLTPQRFGNVDEPADIFNHTNRHFWEAMIPGPHCVGHGGVHRLESPPAGLRFDGGWWISKPDHHRGLRAGDGAVQAWVQSTLRHGVPC